MSKESDHELGWGYYTYSEADQTLYVERMSHDSKYLPREIAVDFVTPEIGYHLEHVLNEWEPHDV